MSFASVVLFFGVLTLCGARRPICTFDPFCFAYTNGCTLTGCSPYKSVKNITCDECVRMCEEDQENPTYDPSRPIEEENKVYCKSIVFDCETQTCKMFCNDDTDTGKLSVDSKSIYMRYSIENCPLTTMQSTTMATASDACPPGQIPKIVMVDKYVHPNLAADHVVPNLDSNGCAMACLKNQLPADNSPINCHSAQFQNGQCTLSSTPATTEDTDNLQKDEQAAFFQKFCFDANLVSNCNDIMEEAPRKVLIGLNKQTIDSASVQDCFAHCLTAQKDHGFTCNSGLFFGKHLTQNCILNVESKETRPDLFIDYPDAEDRVTYFSPKCSGGAPIAIDTATAASTASTSSAITLPTVATISPIGASEASSVSTVPSLGAAKNSRKADWPLEANSACRALIKNGAKNCRLGTRMVDGVKRFCSKPIDC